MTHLTDDDRAVIQEAAREHASSSRPRDPSVPGCLLAFIGMILLTVTPGIGGFMEIPRLVVLSLFAFAILLLFAGAGISIAGRGASLAGWSRSRMDAAVGPILAWAEGAELGAEAGASGAGVPESPDGARRAALRSAVTLLLHAWHAGPSGLVPTMDAGGVAERLGPRGTALVVAVERDLLRRSGDGTGTPGLPRPFLTAGRPDGASPSGEGRAGGSAPAG